MAKDGVKWHKKITKNELMKGRFFSFLRFYSSINFFFQQRKNGNAFVTPFAMQQWPFKRD
jgi:hypothetical protein